MTTPAKHDDETVPEDGLLTRWRQTEPVRLWLYGVSVPLVALLVGYGALSEAHSVLWLAVAAAALLGGGTEVARQWAVSPATARSAVRTATRDAWDDVDDEPEAREQVARHVFIRYSIPS